jgi:predicted Fe-Mo cluster-binding NifX family protein
MIVAVPLFGHEVAPRFAFADRFLIAEVVDDEIRDVHHHSLLPRTYPERINYLGSLGVDVLLCSGIVRQYVPLAQSLGIRVIAGLVGDAREVLASYARNELSETETEVS